MSQVMHQHHSFNQGTAVTGAFRDGHQIPPNRTEPSFHGHGNGHAHPSAQQERSYANGQPHFPNIQSTDYKQQNNVAPHQAPAYHFGTGNSRYLTRTITPGGHFADDDLIAIANSHRKIANPLPLGVFGFSTTTLLLGLYHVGVLGLKSTHGVIGFGLAYGGTAQYLAGLWEFASGNTYGATVFCSFGGFWWGLAFIDIPFFGLTGNHNGVPGVYAPGSPWADEASSAIQLYSWIWFGITSVYLCASTRGSVSLFLVTLGLWLTFIMLGIQAYTGNDHFLTAGGAVGIFTGFVGFYLGIASFLSPTNSYFTLPVAQLGKKD